MAHLPDEKCKDFEPEPALYILGVINEIRFKKLKLREVNESYKV